MIAMIALGKSSPMLANRTAETPEVRRSTEYGVVDSFLGDGADCDTRLGAEDAPIMEHTVILFKVQCQEPKKGEYERRKTKTQCPSNRAPVWILISFSPYGVLHTPYCHPGEFSVLRIPPDISVPPRTF